MKRLIREWLGCPADGEALLNEARLMNLGGTTALIFERSLSQRELAAIEEAWKRHPEMPTPPPASTDPGTLTRGNT